MKRFLLNAAKALIITVGILVTTSFATLFFPALTGITTLSVLGLVGYGAFVAGRGIGAKALDAVRGNDAGVDGAKRSKERRQGRNRVFDRTAGIVRGAVGGLFDDERSQFTSRKGFILENMNLPKGLVPNVSSVDDRMMFFDADGVRSAIRGTGNPSDGSVTYEYVAKGEKADRAPDDSRVEKVREGDAVVFRSRNPEALLKVFRECNPEENYNILRESRHTSQYIIPGCHSYEEAVAVYKRMKDYLEPVNSYDEMTDTVDGKVGETVGYGGPLTAGDLGPMDESSFIVNDTSITVRTGIVSSRDGFDPYSDIYSSLHVENDMSVESVLSDGMPEGVVRSLSLDGQERFVVHTAKELDGKDSGLNLYVNCKSAEEAEAVLSGHFPSGALDVRVYRVGNEPGNEGYLVRIPVDAEVLSRLELTGDASPSLVSRCESMGLNRDDITYSRLIHETGNALYVNARLRSGSLSLDKVKVNGVSASVPVMDAEKASQWSEEASRIESVSMKIDAKNAKVKVNSVVYDGVAKTSVSKTESFPLTEKQLQDFSRRGVISKDEMKDFLMRTHPDYFKTYSVDGKPVIMDPVGDFVKGKRVSVQEVIWEHKKQAEAQKEALKAKPSRKENKISDEKKKKKEVKKGIKVPSL